MRWRTTFFPTALKNSAVKNPSNPAILPLSCVFTVCWRFAGHFADENLRQQAQGKHAAKHSGGCLFLYIFCSRNAREHIKSRLVTPPCHAEWVGGRQGKRDTARCCRTFGLPCCHTETLSLPNQNHRKALLGKRTGKLSSRSSRVSWRFVSS